MNGRPVDVEQIALIRAAKAGQAERKVTGLVC